MRRSLAAAALLTAALALTGARPAGSALSAGPIRHVVEVMLENHTFDDLFAGFPGARGIPAATSLPDPAGSGTIAPLVAGAGEGDVQGAMDNSRPSELFAMDRRGASYAMDRFSLVAGSGLSAITTFPPADDPDLQYLARRYELADDNFQPVIGPTNPNVLSALTGSPSGAFRPGSIFDQLWAAGLSARAYYGVPLWLLGGTVWARLFPPGRPALATTAAFFADLRAGTLPAFSFVRPGVGYSSEPPEDLGQADDWLGEVVAALAASPEWSSTALFVTYDEGGGFYDHVPPPVADPAGYGTRTPLVVVSPYARRGVFGAETTTVSVLAFTDRVFHLRPLDAFVARQDDLLGAFDLGQRPAPAPRPPLVPPLTLAAYAGPDRLHDVAPLAVGQHAELLLECNRPSLALDTAASGPVSLRLLGGPGAGASFPATVRMVGGVATIAFSAGAPGYYRLLASGPGGSLGYLTLDVATTPLTP